MIVLALVTATSVTVTPPPETMTAGVPSAALNPDPLIVTVLFCTPWASTSGDREVTAWLALAVPDPKNGHQCDTERGDKRPRRDLQHAHNLSQLVLWSNQSPRFPQR